MKIFITGITGSLGQEVSRQLLATTEHEIIGYSRDEKKQSEIKPHPRLTLVLGDVRDRRRVIESSRNCDLIMHFAALKRVDALENNPEESIETNIEGTRNILGAQRLNRIPRVVLSSTDKACKPINVYGYCKAISEKLVLRNKNNVVVRYGNVLASRGSVVPLFVEWIQKSEPVLITDIHMTRFFITLNDAAEFVLKSAFAENGGLQIFDRMKSARITEIVSVISELLHKPMPELVHVGKRPGEKLHEDLVHEHEKDQSLNSFICEKYSKAELSKLLYPIVSQFIRKSEHA